MTPTAAEAARPRMRKYPRTQHLHGSRLQPGDEDLTSVPLSSLAGRYVVVEEKVDGANAALSFDAAGTLRLQSRGHFLRGGPRERHFDVFKQWAHARAAAFWDKLQDRYVLYGEWLYAKHTVFYDRLPHYFLEFDVLDLHQDTFLSTARRRTLLAGLPIQSVPVLWSGTVDPGTPITSLVGPSTFKSPRWQEALKHAATTTGMRPDHVEQALRETDPSDLMEGLYLKVEDESAVLERYKYVRASFLTTVLDSGSHWLDRPIVPNQLAPGVDLFA